MGIYKYLFIYKHIRSMGFWDNNTVIDMLEVFGGVFCGVGVQV